MAITEICEKELCMGCGACCQVCPRQAIIMEYNEEGFLYPKIEEKKCVMCNLCKKKCPVNAEFSKKEATFFMGWHKNSDILKNSSSGGIFSVLAEHVFDKDGVVFGAVKNRNNEIVHVYVSRFTDLEPMRLSKYYQSNISDSYQDVKKFLLAGRYVLFSGTACQVAGLLSYLGSVSRDRLITVDCLCHGVTSKKVIDEFIKSKEKKFKKKIVNYDFRVKEEKRGWYNGGGTRMKIYFEDGTNIVEPNLYDTFFLGFNNNFFLRESCYHCKFCGTKRISDFTLADYWRCNHKEISEEQLHFGVSLILANSEKALELINELKQKAEIFSIDGENAIAHNQALVKPQNRPEIREIFFTKMYQRGYDYVIVNQFRSRFIKRRIKKILQTILPKSLSKKMVKNI